MKITKSILLLLAAGSIFCNSSRADDAAENWVPELLGAQYTGIVQHLSPFAAAYSGPLSLTSQGDTQRSHTFGGYFGMQMPEHLQAYLDVEMFKGDGIGRGTGLGGLTDGDVVRAGTGLPKTPYVARAYLQYTLPLAEGIRTQSRAQDQLPGPVPVSSFTVKLGKLSVADDFDQNSYANNVRSQFMNLAFTNNLAWDYAADTRGYTGGLLLAYAQPDWALKFGVYRMPVLANHPQLEWPLSRAQGDNLELDLTPPSGTVIRLLVYRNVARMGDYAEAITLAEVTHTQPDIVADDRDGRVKHGYGINLEQALADDGDTGLFARYGWDDGATESFAYAEVDETLSVGAQLSGAHWGRAEDRLAAAASYQGLSTEHRDYLAASGCGFILCDGALSYGYEKTFEAYYRFQIGNWVQLSPDYQYIQNPGYNRARGPARVLGLRLHASY